MLYLKKLQELQEHKKVSQKELAEIIGLTRNGLQKKLQSPKKTFYIEELQKIADHFNIPITYFFTNENVEYENLEKQIDFVFSSLKKIIVKENTQK